MRFTTHISLLTTVGTILFLPTLAMSQLCTDGANPTYTQYNYLDGGLVIHIAKIDRGNNTSIEAIWPDHDWSYQIRPASCVGRKFGKDCDSERQRFIGYFWDQQNSNWKGDTVGYLQQSKTKCGLVGSTTRDLWIDANSTALKYACHLDSFGNHQLVEAEVSVSGANYLDERKDLGGLLDRMTFSSTQTLPCYEPSSTGGICGQDVLMYGLVVSDNNHACGKPEVHPVHAVLLDGFDANDSRHSANYSIYFFADYGKAAGFGADLAFDHIHEYWNSAYNTGRFGASEPYANVDLGFLRDDVEAAMRRRATPDTVSFANIYDCPYSAAVSVHGNGHTATAVSAPTGIRGAPQAAAPPSPPLVTGGCPFLFVFNADFVKKGDIIGGGLADDDGQYVKGGFAALAVRPSWAVTNVTHWGDVHLVGNVNSNKDTVPGGNPNTNYYKLTAQSSVRATVEGATQPKEISTSLDALAWCLPLSAIIEEEVAEHIAQHIVEKESVRPRPLSIFRPQGPSANAGSSPDGGRTVGSPGEASNQLPCYAGRARGKNKITFYIPFPPPSATVSPAGVTPSFSFDIGATGTYGGRELTWLQQKILVYGTSNLQPAPHDPRHLPRPPMDRPQVVPTPP